MTRRGAALGVLGVICLLVFPSLSAQTTSGTVAGKILDENGRPVAEAIVQARSVSDGQVRSAVSDEDGDYRLALRPGQWTVVAYGADGTPSESRMVDLGLQQTVKLDLKVGGGFTEDVMVRAEAPLIDPTRIHGELRVDDAKVNNLPVVGRSVTSLAMLDASVRPTPPGNFFGERDAVMVLNGQSGRANSFLVDGLDNNDYTSGTTLNAFFSQLVVKEFVVMTHQYSAEFGGASGGVMNIVTDRGGNQPRYGVFFQGAVPGLGETGSFVDALPESDGSDKSRMVSTGFKVSGPLKKDRAFYLLAYEHNRADNVAAYVGIDRYGNSGGWMIAPQRGNNLFLRTDFNLGANNMLMFRLSADDRENDGINVGGITTPEAGFRIDERDYQLGASLTTIVSPNKMNEVRLLAGISSFNQYANSDRPGVSRPSGIFGGNALNRQIRDEDRLQLLDNFTWQTGDHAVKFGAGVTWTTTRIQARFNPNGNFLYESDLALEPGDCGNLNPSDFTDIGPEQDPEEIEQREREMREGVYCSGDPDGIDDDGDGIVDELGFLITYPVVYSLVDGEPDATLDDTRISLFMQDNWRATPRLFLDFGIRYDLSTFTLPATARVDSTVPNGGAGRDYNNIAPRFGFTYQAMPNSRLVLRGGAGVFYDKLVLAFPAVAAVTSGTEIGLFFPQGAALEITEDVVEEVGIDLIQQGLVFPEDLVMRFSTGTELDTPYAVQANIGVEGTAGRRGMWRADIIRSQGYHLPLMRDLNPTTNIRPGMQPDHLYDNDSGSIAAVVTEGRSWYTGINLGYRFQNRAGWLSASYTWSRSEDMGPDPLKSGIYLPPDSVNLSGERARSDFDRRHRMVVAGEMGLGFMGLRGSAVLQLASGAPFNVTTGQDDNLDGIASDRPEGLGRNTGKDTPIAVVNEIRAREQLDPYTGSLEEPWLAQLDLRIWKAFPFSEGKGEGQFFIQIFNVLNRYNGGPIEGRVISNNFGKPIGQVTIPRTVQFGAGFNF
jgi:hypothetical protein